VCVSLALLAYFVVKKGFNRKVRKVQFHAVYDCNTSPLWTAK